MSRYAVIGIGPADLTAGLALAGVPRVDSASLADSVARLTTLLARDDVGIVIADRRVVDALPDAVKRRAARRATPILLAVPRPDWTTAGEAPASDILDLLQRAIGYRVRLQ
jgi:vacuolar-type H+-ATPase subunit F/Vma7